MLNGIQMSLRTKLFAAFFMLALLVISIVGAVSFYTTRSALTAQLTNNLTIISGQLAENVDRYLDERLNDTQAIALHYSLFNLKTTTSNQNEMLAKYLKIYPYYEKVNIINIEDIRLPEGVEADGTGPWYMKALSGVATSSDMYISSLTDKPTMSFAAPVYDEGGNIVSVITTNLDLNHLWDLVDRIERENKRKGLTGYAFLVNEKGEPIAYPDKRRLFSDKMLENADRNLIDAVENMRAGRSGVVRYVYDGVDKHAAYTPCTGFGGYRGHGWSACVTYPHHELMAPLKPLVNGYLIVALVATLLALVISTLVSNYLVRPILSLKEGAARIGNGDFSFRIDEGSRDELGELAGSYNYMAQTLLERDRQINEYTRTLTAINSELERKQDELSRANEVLVKTNEELKRLERQKAEFTAMITHDIKSPLSTILTYADMILGGSIPLTEIDINKTMRSIFTSGHKILTLVENFLISSAIDAGRLELNLSALNLSRFITEESELFRPQMDKKGITFKVEQDVENILVKADKIQLERAFSNIISNSVKFTPEGGEIRVTLGREDTRAYISIRDSGTGISEENQRKIFGKFRRADEAASVEGIGLGLYIARAIVDAHGGDIQVDSEDGKGSVFTIFIPMAE